MKADLMKLEDYSPGEQIDGERPIVAKAKKTREEHLALISEKFPRIGDQIATLWGTQECHDRVAYLLCDDSTGRAGFPFDVFLSMMALHNMHNAEFGFTPSDRKYGATRDTW